jgi:hypothetical protein
MHLFSECLEPVYRGPSLLKAYLRDALSLEAAIKALRETIRLRSEVSYFVRFLAFAGGILLDSNRKLLTVKTIEQARQDLKKIFEGPNADEVIDYDWQKYHDFDAWLLTLRKSISH